MSSSPLTAAPSTAQIVIEILELLDSRTDSEHGLTAIEISKSIGVSEKTVRGHLKALHDMQPFGRRVEHLERRDLAKAESVDPSPDGISSPY